VGRGEVEEDDEEGGRVVHWAARRVERACGIFALASTFQGLFQLGYTKVLLYRNIVELAYIIGTVYDTDVNVATEFPKE
jgi:hypothetical protein